MVVGTYGHRHWGGRVAAEPAVTESLQTYRESLDRGGTSPANWDFVWKTERLAFFLFTLLSSFLPSLWMNWLPLYLMPL
jgi:hypothetical protein